MDAKALLVVDNIEVRYGVVSAVRGVSLDIPKGAVIALIGANGAGKTSLLRAIAGLEDVRRGAIWWLGERINGLPPHQIAHRGISMVPEGRRLFSRLSVMDNLRMGSYLNNKSATFRESLDTVFNHFPRLKERVKQKAGTLSGGEQQMLAIGRALMSGARLMMLDEPSLGLSPIMTQEITKSIKELNARGISILLVEQNAKVALSISSWCYALERGELVLSGPPAELLENEKVKNAYLGV